MSETTTHKTPSGAQLLAASSVGALLMLLSAVMAGLVMHFVFFGFDELDPEKPAARALVIFLSAITPWVIYITQLFVRTLYSEARKVYE